MNTSLEAQSGVAKLPGHPLRIADHQNLIAPSLAAMAVLLAAIGLSRDLLMDQPLTSGFVPARQRAARDLARSPESIAVLDNFSDGSSLLLASQGRLEGKEMGQLRPGDSPGKKNETEAEPKVELEAELNAELGAIGEALQKRDDHIPVKSSLKVSPAPPSPVLDPPAEEFRGSWVRARASLEESDRELNRLVRDADNYPASSDYDEISISYTKPGFDFLRHYQQTENLNFQPATGYWANTYIPGDPKIRLLSARLAGSERSWLQHNAALEQDIEPVSQPFDAPVDSALALSLMADSSHVSAGDSAQGPTRMRLQVGIQGIEHRRGLRPAMNVGVVVDLPGDAPDELRIATRALLDALLQSKQSGDRFSLVMTSQKGSRPGLLVPAEDFRFGSLQLAKQIIQGRENSPVKDDPEHTGPELAQLNLFDAMQRAGALVQQNDDPSRPLGSSSVILISAGELQSLERLTALAHERAKEGITLSVIPLGARPQNSDVEELVLAGLGNRRLLEAPGLARQLIEEELHASSRAVARAARLSVRLAPGVRLINVVGSQRLDAQRAQRVREIENSMDHRLSEHLGIQADRGDDEDGIQIVIPSIFSGDSLTVLLDVVADRPGAIADVSLRYKDLVFLRNGSLSGQLDLPGDHFSGAEPARGPAELAVLKNLLSHHFSAAVEQASADLGRQQAAEAIAALSAMSATIEQARRELPAWANDPDLIRDQQVLDRYIAVLASPQAGAHQPFLADSLRYAAWAKTHRPLEEWK